ncbi:hypothetical protein ACM64Y_11085 [Novispirillum sp. DQ9]|uniref:ribonuclease toxin HepT-like protein n=1 Tax=Novispirillum sp. DQ9 TaxID=3398612 RepID=UPI003C7ED526
MRPVLAAPEAALRRAEEEFARARAAARAAVLPTEDGEYVRVSFLANAVADSFEGIEMVLRRIALDIDDFLPRGADWHGALISQMAAPGDLRPPVITEPTALLLHDLRKFRHLVRHHYAVDLKPALVEENVARMGEALTAFRQDFAAFTRALG